MPIPDELVRNCAAILQTRAGFVPASMDPDARFWNGELPDDPLADPRCQTFDVDAHGRQTRAPGDQFDQFRDPGDLPDQNGDLPDVELD
jgi:hypothetical protein